MNNDCKGVVMGKVDWLINNGYGCREYNKVNKAIENREISLIYIDQKPKVIGVPPEDVDSDRFPQIFESYPELKR